MELHQVPRRPQGRRRQPPRPSSQARKPRTADQGDLISGLAGAMSFAGQGIIAVATSIPPRLTRVNEGKRIDEEYQKLCISSWVAAGFRIVSVNDRDEIPDLASRFPDVEFVLTERNASAWTGRKNPYIADLLGALEDAPEPVIGIVNSDLIFEASAAWGTNLPSLVSGAAVIGHRYDATSLLKGALRRFWPGFDYFFFDKTTAGMLGENALPYAMGLPFWDYWLPIAVAANGQDVRVLERPNVIHLMHAHGYQPTALGDFAKIFSNFVVKSAEQAARPVPQCVSAILPICRNILALPSAADSDRLMDKVTEIITVFLPLIRKDMISFDLDELASSARTFSKASGAKDGAVLDTRSVFAGFDHRRAAGEALEQAKGLVHHGKSGADELFR